MGGRRVTVSKPIGAPNSVHEGVGEQLREPLRAGRAKVEVVAVPPTVRQLGGQVERGPNAGVIAGDRREVGGALLHDVTVAPLAEHILTQ